MAEYTENLNLKKPAQDEQYNVDDFNDNFDKIDDFAGIVPPRALTADKLTTGAKINGVNFKGDTDIITGLGLYSDTNTYNNTNLAYLYDNGKLKIFQSTQNGNIGHNPLNSPIYWTEIQIGPKRNYGEIKKSSLPIINDDSVHLADGSVLDSTNYPGLLSYINSIYPSSVTGDFTVATQDETLGNNEWLGIAYGNGTYIALSSGGLTSTSTDGVNWTTPVQSLTSTSSAKWSTITYGNGIFVAGRAASGTGSRTATYDGTNWTETSNLSINGTIHSIQYGKNIFLMVTETGYTYSSTDGLNWTQKSLAPFSNFTQLIFVDNRFKCLAENGTYMDLYETSDGSTWNNLTTDLSVISGSNQSWTTLFYDDEQYTVINKRGYVSTSSDGINWTTPAQNANLGDPNHTWRNAVYSAEKLQTVVISTSGYISIKEYRYTDVFTTEANWQSSVSTYGECGKYVYDSVNNTLRLPLLNTYITNTTNARELGNLTHASIPNIKGEGILQDDVSKCSGAIYDMGSVSTTNSDPGGSSSHLMGIDASRISSVYSDTATTVKTQSIKQLIYIVVKV